MTSPPGMTFEQFAQQYEQLSGGWFRRIGGAVGFVGMIGALVLIFVMPQAEVLADDGGDWWWLPITAPLGLLVGSILFNQAFNWRYNSLARGRFQCQECGVGLSLAEAATVADQNVCPHCKLAAYPCEEIGEFVSVPEKEVVRPPIEPVAETEPEQAGNPYAPPAESGRTAAAGNRTGCLWIIPNYFIACWNAVRHLAIGREFTIAQLEQLLDSLGGDPINEKYIDPIVAGFQRRSVLWLLLAVVAPLVSALCVWFTLGRENEALGQAVLLVGVYSIAAVLGSLAYAFFMSLAPVSLRRWFTGGAPTVSEVGEKTNVYGIWFLFVDDHGVKFHQPSITIYYRASVGGDVVFGLLNRESLREYRLHRTLEAGDDWKKLTVSFTPSLRCENPDFRGDQIRILPPREMVLEVDSFNVMLPQLPG